MRILLDTNVLVSAILFGDTPRDLLRAVVEGRLTVVTSEHLLDELEDVLARKFRFSKAAARDVRGEMENLAEVVEPITVKKVCRDPDDDAVLAAASFGRADHIVTGDRDLLVLEAYEGVEVCTPAQLAKKIQELLY